MYVKNNSYCTELNVDCLPILYPESRCCFIVIDVHAPPPPDLKVQLQATDYGNFLQNEPSPVPVSVIDEKLRGHLVVEFQHMRNHSVQPLSTFLDYITYATPRGRRVLYGFELPAPQ